MKTKRLLEENFLVWIVLTQVALVCAGVLSRYVFEWSISYTEELTRYLLVWLACLGMPVCWARREMIGFQWPGYKPKVLARITRVVPVIVSVLFFAILLVSSIKMIHLQWRYGNRTSVMGWPIYWVSLALPAGCIGLFLRLLWFRNSTKR